MVEVSQVAGGLLLLLLGGEFLVRASVNLAHRYGISPLIVGLTVVAFGTSAPELLVCLVAALQDAPAIAVGNVIGSNIANILLVLGVAGLIAPLPRNLRSLKRDGVVAILATALFALLAQQGAIVLWHGAAFLGILALYLVLSYRHDRRSSAMTKEVEQEVKELSGGRQPVPLVVLRLVAGLAGVLAGSELLVRGAVVLAETLGVPQEVIGITVVAIGTSLPELATAMVAAYRGHADIGLGNVVGSNIFNILAIMGVVSVVTPVAVPESVLVFDLWVMLAVIAVFVPLAMSRRFIGRRMAATFLLVYAVYVVAQFTGMSGMPTAMH